MKSFNKVVIVIDSDTDSKEVEANISVQNRLQKLLLYNVVILLVNSITKNWLIIARLGSVII